MKVPEKIYKRIIGRVEAGKIPIYPHLMRQTAIVRYKAEKQAEFKRKQAELKRKAEAERIRRERAARKARARYYERQAEAAEQAAIGQAVEKSHLGGSWVRLEAGGTSGVSSGRGMAAISPKDAKAEGRKWGKVTKGVFVPMSGEPTMADYYGIKQWKIDQGHYKHNKATEDRMKKEVAAGRAKYGITAPAWAGLSQPAFKKMSDIRSQISLAYSAGVHKLLTKKEKEVGKAITAGKQLAPGDILTEMRGLSSHPIVQKHISATEHFKGLDKRGRELELRAAGYKEVQSVIGKRKEEYAKGGWQPKEIGAFNTMIAAAGAIGKPLQKETGKYSFDVTKARGKYRQETGYSIDDPAPTVKKYKGVTSQFTSALGTGTIREVDKGVYRTQKQISKEEFVPSALAKIGVSKVSPPKPTKGFGIDFAIAESIPMDGKPTPKDLRPDIFKGQLPSSIFGKPESLIAAVGSIRPTVTSKIKEILGYYPEKEKILTKRVSEYETANLDLANSLNITSGTSGKKVVVINGTKYVQGDTGFSNALDKAINTKLLEPLPTQPTTELKGHLDDGEKLHKIAENAGWIDTKGVIRYPDNKAGNAWATKYDTYIENDKKFIEYSSLVGGESYYFEKYFEYTPEGKRISKKIDKLNELSTDINKQVEASKIRHRASYFGLMGRYDDTAIKTSAFLEGPKKATTAAEQIKIVEERLGRSLSAWEKKRMHQIYKDKPKVKEYYEKKYVGFIPGLYKGSYEEVRDKPLKFIATTAAFAALPTAFKGTGLLWKGIGGAGALPRVTAFVPKTLGYGMGSIYGGVVGYETYKALTLEGKGKVLGRTGAELAAMSLGFGVGTVALPHMTKLGMQFNRKDMLRFIRDTKGTVPRGSDYWTKRWAKEAARDAKIAGGEYQLHRTGRQLYVTETVKKPLKVAERYEITTELLTGRKTPLFDGVRYVIGKPKTTTRVKRHIRRGTSLQARTTTRLKQRAAIRLATKRIRKVRIKTDIIQDVRTKTFIDFLTGLGIKTAIETKPITEIKTLISLKPATKVKTKVATETRIETLLGLKTLVDVLPITKTLLGLETITEVKTKVVPKIKTITATKIKTERIFSFRQKIKVKPTIKIPMVITPIILIPPKEKEKIKKPRKDPWEAYQTSVKNPILSADELIQRLL